MLPAITGILSSTHTSGGSIPPVVGLRTFFGVDPFGNLNFDTVANGGLTPLQRESLPPQVQRAAFLSYLHGTSEYTFENDAFGDTAPIALSFTGTGSPILATLSGGLQVENRPGIGTFNTTLNGANWFESDTDLNITFARDICAFGMYVTDLGDESTTVLQLTLTDNLGVTSTVSTPALSPGDGSLFFFGFVSTIAKYRSIAIQKINGPTDIFGIDDLIAADQGQYGSAPVTPPLTLNPYTALIDPSVSNAVLSTLVPTTVASIGDTVTLLLDTTGVATPTAITTTSGWAPYGLDVFFVQLATTHVLAQSSAMWFHAENYGSGMESTTTIPVLKHELYHVRLNVYMTFGNATTGQMSIDSGWHDRVDVGYLPTNGWASFDLYMVATQDAPLGTLRFTVPPNRPTGEYYVELVEFSKVSGFHLYQPDPAFKPSLQTDGTTRFIHFQNSQFMIELNPQATLYPERQAVIDIDVTGQTGINITYTN